VGSAYIGQVVFGFVLALLFRQCSRTVQAIVGGIIILSWVVPELIAGFMWYALLGQGGVLQQAAHAIGLPYSQILVTHPMAAVNLANTWRGVAFSMMLFTAALAAFPTDLLEAAQVDGAGSVKRTLFVVLPNLKGTFLIDIVLVTLATLNDFVLIFTMTGGGPGEESQVLSTYMYQLGFTEYRIAYATAVSVVLLIIVSSCRRSTCGRCERASEEKPMAQTIAISGDTRARRAPAAARHSTRSASPGAGTSRLGGRGAVPGAVHLVGRHRLHQKRDAGSFLQRGLTTGNFSGLFAANSASEAIGEGVGGALLNSLYLSGGTMVITTVIAVLTAYPLSRFNIPGRNVLVYAIVFVTGLPIIAVIIPTYDIFVSLNFVNSLWWTVLF